MVLLVGLSSVLLIIGKADPLRTFGAMYRGAFGSRVGFGETLIRFAPVTLIAIGLVPSLRIGLFNIGAPGQIGMGALCASLISFSLAGLSSPFVLAAAFAAGCAGAPMLISPDLEDLFDLADRIVVVANGRIVGEVDPQAATPQKVGALLGGVN